MGQQCSRTDYEMDWWWNQLPSNPIESLLLESFFGAAEGRPDAGRIHQFVDDDGNWKQQNAAVVADFDDNSDLESPAEGFDPVSPEYSAALALIVGLDPIQQWPFDLCLCSEHLMEHLVLLLQFVG